MTPSPRGRFKTVDCTLSDRVLDEMLFGRLDAAAGGPPCTLFLKEVGRLGQAHQRRLLESLIGATVATWPDRAPARVIASTTESLFDRVVIGTFDDRLFYRLNVIHLNMRGG
jgi:DNA-binding NtrC family response regulator